jgi:hypothetical protein
LSGGGVFFCRSLEELRYCPEYKKMYLKKFGDYRIIFKTFKVYEVGVLILFFKAIGLSKFADEITCENFNKVNKIYQKGV